MKPRYRNKKYYINPCITSAFQKYVLAPLLALALPSLVVLAILLIAGTTGLILEKIVITFFNISVFPGPNAWLAAGLLFYVLLALSIALPVFIYNLFIKCK